VKLLHAIYSSPKELLAKAEADGAELLGAVRSQDKARARAALFNFTVTCYHVWDWVRAYRPDLDRVATNPLRLHESLAACRDLANASKHAVLTVTRGSYKKHPPVVEDVVMSAPVSLFRGPSSYAAGVSSGPSSVPPAWRFKVQLTTGRRIPVEDLVAEAIAAWTDYFARHSIK